MYAKITSSLELMRFGRSVITALIVLPLTWRLDHYLIFMFFLLFSFAFNDWIDADMDKDGHPNRPIPSGRISRLEAGVLSALLVGIVIIGTVLYAPDLTRLFAFACIASTIYSWILKRHLPLIATPAWSLCVTSIVLTPTDISLLGWALFFLVLYNHEILLDMRDEHSDRIHCTTPSIATLLGKNCWWLVFGLWVLTVLLQKYGNLPLLLPLLMEENYDALTAIMLRHTVVVVITGVVSAVVLWRALQRNAKPLEMAILYYKSMFILSLQLI